MSIVTPEAAVKRRRRRDRWVTAAFFFIAIAFGTLASVEGIDSGTSDLLVVSTVALGVPACFALLWRKKWPTEIAWALAAAGVFSPLAGGAAGLALFSLAIHRPWKTAALVGGFMLVTAPVFYEFFSSGDSLLWIDLILIGVVNAALIGWGAYIRTRRELVESFRQRAIQAEADRDLRIAQAKEQERTRIAREMHDVLAHRISLVALNAGALEFRPDADPEEIQRAAGTVRASAHEALEELREVILVLRAEEGEGSLTAKEPPQPTIDRLDSLIEEIRDAGSEVAFETEVDWSEEVPDATGRTVYRVVQEGLTNARKHAPGGASRVTVAGSQNDGLTVEVSNRRPLVEPDGSAPAIPGSGSGLIGLQERVTLAGGRLDYGPQTNGEYRLRAWLPWTA